MLLRGGGLGLLNLVETGLGQGELLLEVLNDYTAVRKVCGCQVRAVEVSGECPITKKRPLVLGCKISVLEGNIS